MFTAEGTIIGVVDGVIFAEPKFSQGPHDFDICIHLHAKEDEAQADYWRGEVSANYGKGNFANMTQAEITMKTLRNIGFEGDDVTTLEDQIMGKEIPVTVKASEKDGRTFYNIKYIGAGGGDRPVGIDKDAVKSRISALFGSGAAETAAPAEEAPAPKPTPKPAAAAKPANPFGGAPAAAATTGKNPFAKTAGKNPF